MTVTLADWMRCVICSKQAKASCFENVLSGLWSECCYALSALRSLLVITMCYHGFSYRLFPVLQMSIA